MIRAMYRSGTRKATNASLLAVCLASSAILMATLYLVEPARRPITNFIGLYHARLQGWMFAQAWQRKASQDPKPGHSLVIYRHNLFEELVGD